MPVVLVTETAPAEGQEPRLDARASDSASRPPPLASAMRMQLVEVAGFHRSAESVLRAQAVRAWRPEPDFVALMDTMTRHVRIEIPFPGRYGGGPDVPPLAKNLPMRWLFVAVLTLHGLIHFMGPAKAFGWADLSQLQMPISRVAGLVWGFAGLAFLAMAALYMSGLRGWWVLALGATVLSQGVILASWSDARIGTVANLLILGVALATILGRAGGSPSGV